MTKRNTNQACKSFKKKKENHQLSENNCKTPEASFLSPDLRHFEEVKQILIG
jgi:hypothetical protein